MSYGLSRYVPYIPSSEYDKVAEDFLDEYFPDALRTPQPVPIEKIARESMGLDVRYVCLSEEQDIYGITVFTDGKIEVYDPAVGLYDLQQFKAKTVLIDPEAVKKTNVGCKNNTIAHECVHWYKHRRYYKAQQLVLPRYASICKCHISQLPSATDDEARMEAQAIGIAPRILMPKSTFTEAAEYLGIACGRDNYREIENLADFFNVSKHSVKIRLEECNLI